MNDRQFDRFRTRKVTLILAGAFVLCSLLAAAAPRGYAETRHANTWPQRGAAAARALTWLHGQQQPDGSMGARTADAAYVIALAGENPDGPAWRVAGHSPLDVLRDQAATYLTDAGRTGKVLRAAAAAHQDVHDFGGVDLVARLNSFYDPATGFFHPGQLFYNALAVIGLAAAGQPVPAATVAAISQQQHAGGGWEWRIGGPDDEVDTTGMVMEALAAAGLPANSATLAHAAGFLAASQQPDAGWSLNPSGTTNSNSTSLAVGGLLAAQVDPLGPPFVPYDTTALARLLALQQPDGSFNYQAAAAGDRLMATLDALTVLLQPFPGDELPPARIYVPLAVSHR